MLESNRLWIRPLCEQDRAAFVKGVQNQELCRLYGLSKDMDCEKANKIFDQFSSLSDAYAIVDKENQTLVGFLLDVLPEIPKEIKNTLPERGRTFAYAIFGSYQRRGYMFEALQVMIPYAFQIKNVDYIHCGRFDYNLASANLLRKLGFRDLGQRTFREKVIVDEVLLSS